MSASAAAVPDVPPDRSSVVSVIVRSTMFCDFEGCPNWADGVAGVATVVRRTRQVVAKEGWVRVRVSDPTGTATTSDLCPEHAGVDAER